MLFLGLLLLHRLELLADVALCMSDLLGLWCVILGDFAYLIPILWKFESGILSIGSSFWLKGLHVLWYIVIIFVIIISRLLGCRSVSDFIFETLFLEGWWSHWFLKLSLLCHCWCWSSRMDNFLDLWFGGRTLNWLSLWLSTGGCLILIQHLADLRA